MISGKSRKIGKSKESKRPVLNVDKILNFRQKGPWRGRIGFLRGFWDLWGFGGRGDRGPGMGFWGVFEGNKAAGVK